MKNNNQLLSTISILFIVMLLNISTNAQCLSGSYVVGAGGNYTTLKAAIAALDANGVCGPVTFLIKAGTHVVDTIIGPVNGSGPSNPILFQPLTSNVVIEKNYNSGLSYCIKLKNVSFVTFNGISFSNSNLGFGHQIEIDSLTDHINIISCNFSYASAAIYANNISCSNINIDSSSFTGGYAGITLTSADSIVPGNNIWIQHSVFHNAGYSPLLLRNLRNVKINNNYFVYDNVSTDVQYIQIEYCQDSLEISKNKLTAGSGSNGNKGGIKIDSCFTSGQHFCLIANNMITLQIGAQTDFAKAIWINKSSGVNIINNSINYYFPNPDYIYFNFHRPFALIVNQSNRLLIQNNIIICDSDGFAFDIKSSDSLSMDYNIFYTKEFQFGYSNDTLIPSLHDWNKYYGQDIHSNVAHVVFNLPVDLHLTPAGVNRLTSGAGVSNPLITDDIDNDLRNAVSPDIGADEFSFSANSGINNSGVTGVTVPCFTCDTTSQLMVKIQNYGSAILNSVTINWIVNGVVQSPFTWNGALNSGNTSSYFTIGTLDMHYGPSSNIQIFTSSPNNQTDNDPSNDSLKLATDTIRMGGEYTIGGVNPDFATIKEAADTLNLYGICRNAIFDIRPGLYTDTVKFIGPIGSLSWYQGVTVRSETHDSADVIISSNDTLAAYFINLKEANFFRFEDLSFDARFTSSASQVLFTRSCNIIEFYRCKFIGYYSNFGAMFMKGIDGMGNFTAVTNFKAADCHFINVPVMMSGSTSSPLGYIPRVTIERCIFDSSGISIGGYFFSIKSSLFNVNRFAVNNGFGISCGGVTDTFEISNNVFNCIGRTSGIEVGSANTIATTIFQDYHNARIYNNIFNRYVNLQGGDVGLNISNSNHIDIVNNTFVLRGTVYTGQHGYEHIKITGNSCNAYNNIFANYTPATYILNFNNTNLVNCDYNSFYDLGNQFLDTSQFHSWQNTTGFDSHSQFAEPHFVSNSDLHIQNDTSLIDRGKYFSFLVNDFEGQLRDTIPDIGADEYGVILTQVPVNSSQYFSSWKVYPNPASDRIYLSPQFTVKQDPLVQIINIQGRIIYESKLNRSDFNGAAFTIVLTNSNLGPGLYLINVYEGENSFCTKISVMPD